MLKVRLEDIMSEDVVTIKENATVKQAAHILLRFRVNGILVVKKDNKSDVTGIITTTDLLRFLNRSLSRHGHRMAALSRVSDMPLSKAAGKRVVKVQKTLKAQKALAIMHRRNIHTLPVYDGKTLVGIVGRHDILNIAFND